MSLLFECSLRALLLAAAVAAIFHALRISDARVRHLGWCAVLIAMLLLPAVTAWGPKAALRVLPAVSHVPEPMPVASTPTPSEPLTAAAPIPAGHVAAGAPVHQPPDLLWTVYLLVTGLFLLRLAIGAVQAAQLRRLARWQDGFYSTAECACPVTIGWWRPAILLPVSWSEWPKAELDAVLAHEREHVRRRDPLVQTLAALNRSIFWFHPLAWWLERHMSSLSEEACDAAVVGGGHDAKDYSEILIRQARAVGSAGGRIALPGAAMGGGNLSRRIGRLLDPRPRPVSSRRAIVACAACALAMVAFTACRLERAEKPAPGQPTMNELEHRRAASILKQMDHQLTVWTRGQSLTGEEARQLFAALQKDPENMDMCWTLMSYYHAKGDVKGRDALNLWYIEHQPTARCGQLDPGMDREAYEKGKALWLAYLKQPGASADLYQNAANFLEQGDKPLAESVLQAGQKAYPNDNRWPRVLGRHYALVLAGSVGPVNIYGQVPKFTQEQAGTRYANEVRTKLDTSQDAALLAETAQSLLMFNSVNRPVSQTANAAEQLAKTYVERALFIAPELKAAQYARRMLDQIEDHTELQRLLQLPPAELAAAPAHDRMLVAQLRLQQASFRGDLHAGQWSARNLLDLTAQNRSDKLYAEAVFQANMELGKVALRHSDRTAAVRYLLAAADAPPSDAVRRGEFTMNLPRALVDWGERRAVIDFYRRIAPKSDRGAQFREWADQLAKGINPNLIPTMSVRGCKNDPC